LGQSFYHEETKDTKKCASIGFLSLLRALRFFVVCTSLACLDLALLVLLLVFTFFPSYSQEKKEPLGASLKRLKWDPAKQAAVEKDANPQKSPKGKAEGDVLRVETVLAVFDLLVLDQNRRPVEGLKKEDFIVTEEGAPQEIGTFAYGQDTKARSIVLILDYSGSQLPFLDNSLSAARNLIEQIRPMDEMAIVTDDIRLLIDFTSDKKALQNALDRFRQRVDVFQTLGKSQQYSSLFSVLREMVTTKERPIVLFQTDGDELNQLQSDEYLPPAQRMGKDRPYSFSDITRQALRVQATIYTVIPGLQVAGLPLERQLSRAKILHKQNVDARMDLLFQDPLVDANGQQVLIEAPVPPAQREFYQQIAERLALQQNAMRAAARLTGGASFFLERPAQAAGIYARILADINQRYVLGYYPAQAPQSGSLRAAKVEIRNHPEYTVRGRTSYYGR
jgi:VWFA-related protein